MAEPILLKEAVEINLGEAWRERRWLASKRDFRKMTVAQREIHEVWSYGMS